MSTIGNHAYWRRPFEAGELCSLFYRSQQVHAQQPQQHEIDRLRRDIDAAEARADAAEDLAAWLRHELHAVSKLGLCFSALTGANKGDS
jgi:hypothetical protein